MQFSVYLNAIRGNLIAELKELYEDESIDSETKNKLKLLQFEVLAPGHNGSLSYVLADCGYSVRLTRLESTRAWLSAVVSSIPVLLELTRELAEAIMRRRRRGALIAKVSEDYVKEILLPGVVSIAPIAAYYFDVMDAPTLHRGEDKACVMKTLMWEMVTDTSYREVVTIAERIKENIMNLPYAESRIFRRPSRRRW